MTCCCSKPNVLFFFPHFFLPKHSLQDIWFVLYITMPITINYIVVCFESVCSIQNFCHSKTIQKKPYFIYVLKGEA